MEKRRDEQNRRNYLLYLTPEGTEAAEQSLLRQGNYWEHLLQDFTEEEKSTLNYLLEKLERRAGQETISKSTREPTEIQPNK